MGRTGDKFGPVSTGTTLGRGMAGLPIDATTSATAWYGDDLQRIKEFINTRTRFKVTKIQLVGGETLVVKAKAK